MIAETVLNWPGAIAILGAAFAVSSIVWATAWEKSRNSRKKDD